MKKNKKKMCTWLITMALGLAIVGCSNNKTTTTETTKQVETTAVDTSSSTTKGAYSDEDLNTSYSDSDTKIELSNGSADITGDGATFENGNIKITKAGTYVLSGEFDGQIITEVGDEDVVHLVFNGVNITNTTSSAINAATGKKVVITLVDGTTNTLSDGTSYEYADGEDEPDATLFVKNNLTINGTGSLNIDSNYATAIKAKDNLIILDSKINIDSVVKAIKGKDSVTIENADITINAEDDGITTDGAMVINSGNINIEKSGEGLEGVSIDINGVNIDIVATDDGINARGLIDDSATDAEKEAYGEENQADTYLRITGGTVNINASADGIDSNGQVYIDGGTVYVSGATSGPDVALDYNGKAVITGGTFVSTGVQEMAQTFDSSSTQNFITVYYDSAVAAGSEIKVTDKDGNTVLSYNADKEFTFAVISSDKLSTGETYTVTAGDNSNEVTITAGGNTIGESSVAGPGGNGGPGGNPPTGQPPQKPTDANGNEIEMQGPPSGESSQTEKN
ncbi:MAG: carbohydrate-binding domain-containing protein [Lachnospiraceae bacterium]|nr:carbohydrate-binding domain-containing protein [Lachnospiraceae bacterium]